MTTTNQDSCIRNEHKYVKILILGDYGIGKTTLIKTFLELSDIPEDEQNVFERYRVRMMHNGSHVYVELLDLSPGPSAPERRECYPADVNAILLCFSIGHFKSLLSVYNLWIHEARAHYGKRVPIFLVGLRRDLRLFKLPTDCSSLHSGIRVVKESEAEIIHKNCHFHGEYMECSEYNRGAVVNVFNKAFFAAMEN